MILIFLALVIIFAIGFSISRFFLGNKLSAIQALAGSFVIGLMFMGYFILFASLLTGNLETGVYLFMILGGLYALYLAFKNFALLKKTLSFDGFGARSIWERLKKVSWVEAVFVLLFIAFFLDIFTKTIVFDAGSYKVALAGYGDIPFHMAEVSYFINNRPFGLEEPIYQGAKLNYPFLINLLSSSFYVLSRDYIFSFNLPALILNLSGIVLLYSLISKFIKSVSARVCAFLIFLLGSGLEFMKVWKDGTFWAKDSISAMLDYVLHLPYPIGNFYNAVYPAQNSIWTDFITMFLMHQRAFFFGFAAGMLGLLILYLAYASKEKKIFYFYGIFVGFLPLVHTHTFVALLLVSIGFMIWALNKKDKVLVKIFSRSIAISLAISAFLAYKFIVYQSVGKSFIVFRLGWMTEPGGIGSVLHVSPDKVSLWDWFSYMWHNFGLIIPLFIITAVYFIAKRKSLGGQKIDLIFSMIIGALLIFFVLNIVKFQPWDYDSGKIFAYFLLLASILIGMFFDQWKFRFARPLMVLIILPIIASGLIDTFSRTSLSNPTLYEIFSPKDQAVADWIVKNTDSSDVILTGGSHLNSVDSLAGHPVLLGYPGWLWTHGIDYSEREADIKKIYTGSKDAGALIEKYGVKYVVLSSKERYDYKTDGTFLDSQFPIAFQLGGTKIYKVADK